MPPNLSINRTDTLNASVHLRRLRGLDLLAMRGAGSRAYDVPGPGFGVLEAADPTAVADASVAPDSHQLRSNSHQSLATIPSGIAARLPAPGTKPRRQVLREFILELCALRPFSAQELASVLGRSEHKPLVRDYLSSMVHEGLLADTIPAMENHPEQQYTVPEQGLKP